MAKQLLYQAVHDGTAAFQLRGDMEALTAGHMAGALQIKRNTASHYLNELVEEGRVVKVNTRPVYFLDRETFSRRFFPLSKCRYDSLEELLEEEVGTAPSSVLDGIIGAEGSLKKAVEQLKAAALYPGQSLPVILSGPTGVGKSFLAKAMHAYCVELGVLAPDAPFVVFNCAQYSNNPELITANLFGYVKGAFTGADSNRPGLLEAADGGVFFLDEIHRLNPESQEKLFVFMDQGVFQRLGETERTRSASVRFLFATTEPLEDVLLATFLRRIPITIALPELDQRGRDEKGVHIISALLEEVRTCGKAAELTEDAWNALLSHRFRGSVGELRNTVKYLFASSYLHNSDQDVMTISVYDLPDDLLTEKRPAPGRRGASTLLIRPEDTAQSVLGRRDSPQKAVQRMFSDVLALYEEVQSGRCPENSFLESACCQVRSSMVLLQGQRNTAGPGRRQQSIQADLQSVFQQMEREYALVFDHSAVPFLATYFYLASSELRFSHRQEGCLREVLRCISRARLYEDETVRVFLSAVSRQLDRLLTLWDTVFLLLYMRGALTYGHDRMRALVAARGLAASSTATAANALLGEPLVEALDLPFQAEEPAVTQAVCDYLLERNFLSGLVLMTDAASVDTLRRKIRELTPCPVAVVDLFSVPLAVSVARLIAQGEPFDAVRRRLPELARPTLDTLYPKDRRQKAVVVSCFASPETSDQLKSLLEASIPKQLDVAVLTYDFDSLKRHGRDESIFHLYEVVAVAGTTDPEVGGVYFVSLDQLISGQGQDIIRAAFRELADEDVIRSINNNIVKNFSLHSVVSNLTILDTDKVLENIEAVLADLEGRTHRPLPNDKKITLYVHIACMIERLVRQMPMAEYAGNVTIEQCQEKDVESLRDALSVIERKYSVKTPDAEIAYILDILQIKTAISGEYIQKKSPPISDL